MSAAGMLAFAAPGGVMGWRAIGWQQFAAPHVGSSARIVKAVQQGRWNKVRSLGLPAHPLLWQWARRRASAQVRRM